MLSNTFRLNFCYLKIILIVHPCYHPNIIRHILKNKQKNKCVCFHQIIRLIIMKMKMKVKNRSHRCDINRPNKKYKKRLTMMMLICIKQHQATFEAQFMKKLSKSEAGLEKSVAYKKACSTCRMTCRECCRTRIATKDLIK